MTAAVLKFISDAMASANIPYEFMEYISAVDAIPVYWVGEYTEEPPLNEDCMQETQFILTGTGKGSSGVAVFYGNAFPVPTGDGFMKRLQINLTVKEWKVN